MLEFLAFSPKGLVQTFLGKLTAFGGFLDTNNEISNMGQVETVCFHITTSLQKINL